MEIIVHRGTHQIGGVATEIRTQFSRIIIDLGSELTESCGTARPLNIDGVTNANGTCDAVFFTHYHGDHIGQLYQLQNGVDTYMGKLAKKVAIIVAKRMQSPFLSKLQVAKTFAPEESICIKDIKVTPILVDHSAIDSYMFLIEAEGKRVLHTGDFRTHGFRGKGLPKYLYAYVGKVDVVITEGTTLSRIDSAIITEKQIQQEVKKYLISYKYVYMLCSSTNLDRICALSKATPYGKYFFCDGYQRKLIEAVEGKWQKYSKLYNKLKVTEYADNLYSKAKDYGFLMVVRDNKEFRSIMKKFDASQSIILYSMWNGYRTRKGSGIPSFLKLADNWTYLHTSGHCTRSALNMVLSITKPDVVIPVHTDVPEMVKEVVTNTRVKVLKDGEVYKVI
ncbi:MBL fold metallo-hydrolase [Phascolarctobacterium sp.]|uniref:MBL fold metallo-hydrolase n=1 Tax=Phascolarctobacterium sp. TaxID=2049039 RepID=UPI00386A0603